MRTKPEKDDLRANPRPEDLQQAAEAQRRRERHLFPLRVNRQTVIYVTRPRCNAAYADEWRRRHEAKRKEETK